jgi:hypothetical protein
LTTCRECGQQFKANPLDVPIIGEQPNAKTLRFVEALGKHIQKHHPQAGMFITSIGMQFQGYVITKCYETQDPGLLEIQEQLRAHVYRMTRKNYITDAVILDIVARLGFDEEDGRPIVAAFRDMRDALTETGKYKAQPPAETAQKPEIEPAPSLL